MNEEKIVPTVGMGCTRKSGSDSYAYEVITVLDASTQHVIVREMSAKNKAVWPDQDYELKSDPNGRTAELELYHGQLREVYYDRFTKRKRHEEWHYYSHYTLGYAHYYEDPSF